MAWNKRQHKRRTLLLYLEVYDAESQQLLGHIADLTEGGFCLLTKMPLEANALKKILIKIPTTLGMSETIIQETVSIQWSKPDKNPDFLAIGCKFNELSHDNKIVIHTLILSIGFQDNIST